MVTFVEMEGDAEARGLGTRDQRLVQIMKKRVDNFSILPWKTSAFRSLGRRRSSSLRSLLEPSTISTSPR